jgi:hypothetical protein
MGLAIEKPTVEFYQTLRKIHLSYAAELQLIEPYSPQVLLGAQPAVNYILTRGLVESADGGCHAFLSEGSLTKVMVPGPGGGMQDSITDQRTFEGWRKVA